MRFPSKETVEGIRRQYPVGTIGEVRGVDDAGSVLMHWQNGSGLSFIPECDYAVKIVM